MQRTLSPIIHDLAATCAVPVEIRNVRLVLREMAMEVSFDLCPPLGSETRMTFLGTGQPPQDIADLAEKIQDVATDALWFESFSNVWPECPEHPASHALRPTVRGGAARLAVSADPRSHRRDRKSRRDAITADRSFAEGVGSGDLHAPFTECRTPPLG